MTEERVAISKKLVLINATSSVFTRLLNLSVLIFLQPYLLDRVSYGEYALQPVVYAIMMFAPLLTVIVTGGLGRFITVAYAQNNDEEVTRIVSTMFPILCATCFGVLLVGGPFAWFIDRIMDIEPDLVWDARIMLGALVFSIAIKLPLMPFGTGFFVKQRFVLQNVILLGTTVLRYVLLFSLLFGVSTRVLWVILAAVVADLVQIAIVTPLSMRMIPALRFRLSHVHWPVAREVTGFSTWQFLMALGNTIRNALDPIVLYNYASTWDAACYNLANLPFQTLWQLISLAKTNLNPSLTAMHATDAKHRLQNAFLRGNRLALWIFLMPTFPLALFAGPIIDLYAGPDLWLSAILIQINFFSMFTMVTSAMFASIAEAMGKLRTLCLCVVGAHTLNLILTLIFVLYLDMGAIGSCLATGVASSILYPLMVWPLARKTLCITPHSWYHDVLIPGLLPTVCSAPAYWLFGQLIGTGSIVSMVFVLALGAVAYVVSLYMFAARGQDRDDLGRVLGAARGRLNGLLR